MKGLTVADRVRFAINPQRAVQGVLDRIRMGQALRLEAEMSAGSSTGVRQSETRWRGASRVLRSLAGWRTNLGSGRTDLTKNERETMGARSYDAYRNHLIGRAAVTRLRTNVVGTGLQMNPAVNAEVLGLSDDQADELNELIEQEWRLYADNPKEIDIEGVLDMAGLQALGFVTALLGGDCWALTPFRETEGGIYGLKVQLIDPARVSNPNNGPDTQTLQDGVEITVEGAHVAIHVRNRHPADKYATLDGAQWTRHPIHGPSGARRILQVLADKDRIGMTRAAPFLAPILEPLQTLEQYTRAELMAAVVSALFTVFITKQAQQFDDKGNLLNAIQGAETNTKGTAADITLGSGLVVDLAPGEEPKDSKPGRPNANYDAFFQSIVAQIGAALEIPVDELMLRYQASYSAARAAMLQAWRMYVMRRWWLVQQFCHPIYCLWFDEAVARGRIPVTDYADPKRRAAYHNAVWIGPSRGAMQEKDEVDAARARVDAGFSNEQIETAQIMGESWLSIYRGRRRELKRRRADGMELGPAPGQAGAPSAAPGDPPRPNEPRQPGAEPEPPTRPKVPAEVDDDEDDDDEA